MRTRATDRGRARCSGFVCIVVSIVLLAGCGLPKDGSPRTIAGDKIPFGLLGPSTTIPDSNVVRGGATARLYFVDGSKLRPVNRTVEQRDVKLVLDLLVQGVVSTDPLGITTAIPKDTKVIDASFTGDNLMVTLSNEMLNVQSTEQRNAFAQFVYTATDLGVAGVQFRVLDTSGNAQDVLPPTDQAAHPGPLTRADYQQEAPD